MKYLVMILALITSQTVLAQQYDSEIGTVYKTGAVAYETDEFLILRDDLTMYGDGRGYAKEIYWKGPVPSVEERQRVLDHYFLSSFDRYEQKQLHRVLFGIGLDLASTALGITGGVCSEVGPAKHIPVIGIGILIGYPIYLHHIMKSNSRYYSSARKHLEVNLVSGSHTAAGVHNLLTCF